MKDETKRIADMLEQSDPTGIDRGRWALVGMGLKSAGIPYSLFDEWSARDEAGYDPAENQRQWDSFSDDACAGVGLGTVVMILRELGAREPDDHALGWTDAIIAANPIPAVDPDALEVDLTSALLFSQTGESIAEVREFLEAVFEDDELVRYVATPIVTRDGRKVPSRGHSDRTRLQLVEAIDREGDFGAVFGDYDREAGAWIAINPVDGDDIRDANVTSLRHVLVECDEGELEEQLARILQLRLPCSAITFSGNKSVHALVPVHASTLDEYRRDADFIFAECEKAGLRVDRANKNPSRLTRLPGVVRNGYRQTLLATKVGCASFAEWREWVSEQQDDLPPTTNLGEALDDLPPLAEELVPGVLRRGHKCMVTGPSKAGKSFCLMQMAVAVAGGGDWLGHRCQQGKVLYVNLEVDGASALHRFADIYASVHANPANAANIDVLSLRGHATTLDQLAPLIVRRALAKGASPEDGGYSLIILDPIYKILTGDENNASDMAFFVNQFDLICSKLRCSVAYVHHHAKGKAGMKEAQDRFSGSGVFGRDPDAILDLSPLVATDHQRRAAYDPALEAMVDKAADAHGLSERPRSLLPSDLEEWAVGNLPEDACSSFIDELHSLIVTGSLPRAYRLSYVLREFDSPDPKDLWFTYPIHRMDDRGVLRDCRVVGGAKPAGADVVDKFRELEEAFVNAGDGLDRVPMQDMADYLNVSLKTVQRRIDEHPDFERASGKCWRVDD